MFSAGAKDKGMEIQVREIPTPDDEEKNINAGGPSRKPRFITFFTDPFRRPLQFTWRLWLIIFLAMLIPTLIVGTTLLALQVTALPKSAAKASTDPLFKDLGYAKYQGVANGNINSWLGMRYAEKPVGDLRWKAPKELKKNNKAKVEDAKKHGDICLPTPSKGLPNSGASEDCLFVDVMAPKDESKKHPVYVFFQGGGLNVNANPNFDGTHIIENGDNDIIVVTFNYRVGLLGFLASEEVKKDGALNAGLLDQRLLLKWVKDNIEKFGGDKSRVTIGGHSGGANSVNLHLTWAGGKDDKLFSAAVAGSNSFGQQLTISESQYQYDALKKRHNCDNKKSLECLRKVSIKDLAEKNAIMPTPNGGKKEPVFMYSNTMDGDITKDYTYKLLAAGKFVKVPTIFGSDTNEGTVFTPVTKDGKANINSEEDVRSFWKDNWVKLTKGHLDDIVKKYQNAADTGKGRWWNMAANGYGEIRYTCPGVYLSQRYSTTSSPSYQYQWDVLKNDNKASGMGVTHTAEVGSIWGNSKNSPEVEQNPIIGKYWASFIRDKNHDPNALMPKDSKKWEKYSDGKKGKQQKMKFVNDVSKNGMVDMDPAQLETCAYYAKIGADIAQ